MGARIYKPQQEDKFDKWKGKRAYPPPSKPLLLTISTACSHEQADPLRLLKDDTMTTSLLDSDEAP